MEPEHSLVLITAVFAWRVISDTSSLPASGDVVISTHTLPGCEKGVSLALWADKAIEKFLGIFFVDVHA
jgi:hypothetical protein